MTFTEELKSAAHKAGADLIGIAPIDRFDGISAEHHPCSIFPETHSVIVLGKRIARGCLRGIECGRSAQAVGRATTSAVVTAIVLIVLADAFITVLMFVYDGML